MFKRIVFVLLILIVLIGGIVFYLFNKKIEGLENAEPLYSVSADELYNEFESNEETALLKYVDQIIEVKGVVSEVNQNEQHINIILKAENALFGGVNCSFDQFAKEDIRIGDTLRIKGRCQGYLMNVVLNNCVIVHE